MKLKKLTVLGFKSFADKISLDFDCDVIAIVGPNGCGKSNIVDAFRWVLGEQSAKSMRADKMNDVLFAGNEKRKGSNLAEVSVTLTGASDTLKTPYEEITLTRRLYVSGESEYLINRNPVRLKDIQDLFMGSGVGKNAFSVFEQGKLDQITHLHPMQRRLIFDDAANTSRFLVKKKEALSKLAQVSENYLRIKDVHQEIEKQMRLLKKQAQAAAAFQENKEELFTLEKKVLQAKLGILQKKEEEQKEKLLYLQKELLEKKAGMARAEKELSLLKNGLVKEEDAAKKQHAEFFNQKTASEVLKTEIHELKIRLEEAAKKEKALLEEMQNLAPLRKENLKKIEENKKALSKLEKDKNDGLEKIQRVKSEKEAVEKQGLACRQNLRQLQKEEFESQKLEKEIDFQMQQYRMKLEAKKEREKTLESTLADKREKLLELEKTIQSKKEAVDLLSEEIDGLKAGCQSADSEMKALTKKLTKTKVDQQIFSQKLLEITTRRKLLLKLQEDLEGFSTSAKKILQEAKNPKAKFYKKVKTVYAALSAQKGYEKALAGAMHFYSDTLVVENESVLKELLDYAKEKKLTHFSVLSKDRLNPKKIAKNALSHWIKKDDLAAHFLNAVGVVEDFENAQEAHLKEVVTKDGDFIDQNQVIFLSGKTENSFGREAEIQALTEQMQALEEDLNTANNTLAKLNRELQEKEEERKKLLEKHRKKEMALLQENFVLQRALQDVLQNKKESALLEEEASDLKKPEGENAYKELQKAFKSRQSKVLEITSEIQRVETDLQEIEKKDAHLKLQKEKIETQYQKLFVEYQKAAHQADAFQGNEEQNEKTKVRLEKEYKELEEQKRNWVNLLQGKIETLAKKEKILEELSMTLKQIKEKVEGLACAIENEEKKVHFQKSVLASIEKEHYKLELQNNELVAKKQLFEDELKQRFEIASIERSEFDEGAFNLEETEKRIFELRLLVEKETSVNFAAIEEFKEKEERFRFYEEQLTDLDESKKDLEKLITQLDAESRKLFKKTFEEIRKNFQKNFSLLFNGGEADLKFTDSTDILEAGVEIIAKPPGKQMRAISLLSGGEKCLTALALLFSIFEVRPAPFCILDEVDAPLDDFNIDRFSNMLIPFKEKTQFIIVTHNKKTMAFADLLLGISMEEKGVSKLISLAFEKVKSARL